MKSPERNADEITESIFRLIEQGDHDRESRFRMVSAVVQSALSGGRRETLEEAVSKIDRIAWSAPTATSEWALREATKVIVCEIRSLSEDKEGG